MNRSYVFKFSLNIRKLARVTTKGYEPMQLMPFSLHTFSTRRPHTVAWFAAFFDAIRIVMKGQMCPANISRPWTPVAPFVIFSTYVKIPGSCRSCSHMTGWNPDSASVLAPSSTSSKLTSTSDNRTYESFSTCFSHTSTQRVGTIACWLSHDPGPPRRDP